MKMALEVFILNVLVPSMKSYQLAFLIFINKYHLRVDMTKLIIVCDTVF